MILRFIFTVSLLVLATVKTSCRFCSQPNDRSLRTSVFLVWKSGILVCSTYCTKGSALWATCKGDDNKDKGDVDDSTCHRLCARPYRRCLNVWTHFILQQPQKYVVLSSLFYRRGNGGAERLSYLSKVTQLVSSWAGIQTQQSGPRPHTPVTETSMVWKNNVTPSLPVRQQVPRGRGSIYNWSLFYISLISNPCSSQSCIVIHCPASPASPLLKGVRMYQSTHST